MALGGVLALVAGGALLAVATPAGAAPVSLVSSSTPAVTPGAATVPAGICFVSITTEGGRGGGGAGGPSANGGEGCRGACR